jgi:two-component system response regulator
MDYFEDLVRDERSECPALVLLDLNLPKISGMEVLRQIRSVRRFDGTPVIVVSSCNAEPHRAALRTLGAKAYFQKPQDLSEYMELRHIINGVLGEAGKC